MLPVIFARKRYVKLVTCIDCLLTQPGHGFSSECDALAKFRICRVQNKSQVEEVDRHLSC